MKTGTKNLLNFLFIFGTLAIVIYIGFSGTGWTEALDALKDISPLWLLACLAGWFLYASFDMLATYFYLKTQGYPISLRYAFFIGVVGFYYSSITPGASGGQPMQVYYLHKRKVPIGVGTSAVTVKFFCFQLMLMILGSVMWILHPGFVLTHITQQRMWILWVGHIFNMISVMFVLLMAVNRRLVRFLMRALITFGTKLRIVKHPEEQIAKLEDMLVLFHDSVTFIRKRPKEMFLQLLIAALQVLALMSITVFVYFAFTHAAASVPEIITLALLLYITAAYTPLPAGSGAQEGGFALYFAALFVDGSLIPALVIWRFFTCYMHLIMGVLATITNSYANRKGLNRSSV